MTHDLGYLERDYGMSDRLRAVTLLLARVDPDDEKRTHTLRYPGDQRRAARYVRRCQRAYLAMRKLAGERFVAMNGETH